AYVFSRDWSSDVCSSDLFARFFPEQQLLMFFLFPVPVKYAVLIMGAISLLMINAGDGVAHIAHLGGAVFAWIYLQWFWAPSRGRSEERVEAYAVSCCGST